VARFVRHRRRDRRERPRRRVYRRNPGSTPDRSLPAITLDIHDITAA
jgi:hypothetical protein